MNWKQIRKDAGEITVADLGEYPSWKYCLDEEGVEDQTECTMRPFKHPNTTLSLGDCCQVAAVFTFPNEKQHNGWIELGTGEFQRELESPRNLDPEIFLDPDTPAKIRELTEFDLITRCEGSIRINFCLPYSRIVNDKTAGFLIQNVASTLKMQPDELFPIIITPLQAIRGWPNLLQIERFYRPADDNKPYRQFGEIDAPNCPECGQQLRTKLAKQCLDCGHDWH